MKKVSVGDARDVGSSPKRSKKKGYILLIIVAVVLIALFLIGNTGCSSKKSSTTATPTATVMPIPDRVSGLESRVTYLEQHPVAPFDASTLWTTVNALHNYDDAAVLARLRALENSSTNMSSITANISYLNLQIMDLADDNLSARLTALEARVNTHITATLTPTVNATPTPTANVTPTPTAIPVGALSKPIAIYPPVGNMSIPNGSVMFQWTECNATVYEFWFGDNSNNMIPIDTELYSDTQSFLWAAPQPNTYYFWRIRAITGTTVKSSSFWFKTQ